MSLYVDIEKTLGKFTLRVQFQGEDEILGILGASGCGKSMTLKCIAGIVRPDRGEIRLDGRTLFSSADKVNLPPQKRRVGYLFQNYALFPNMTVKDNIAAGVADKSRRKEMVAAQVKSLYLDGLENKYPSQLSGGQQQRVALARILASEPEILMLDEPFSALDSYLRWQVEQELSETLKRYTKTTLFVSHSREEIYRICHSVCVMDAGKSQPKIPVKALFEAPSTLSASILSGCKNYSRIEPAGDHRVRAIDWGAEISCAAAPEAHHRYLGIRAHYFITENVEDGIPCDITKIVDDVFETIVVLRPIHAPADAQFPRIIVELPKERAAGFAAGDRIEITASPANVMLLE